MNSATEPQPPQHDSRRQPARRIHNHGHTTPAQQTATYKRKKERKETEHGRKRQHRTKKREGAQHNRRRAAATGESRNGCYYNNMRGSRPCRMADKD